MGDDILAGTRWEVRQGDVLQALPALPEACVDLVFGSPPYMDARTYGVGAQRGCLEWVEWMLNVTQAAVRVSKGLVLWVVGGVQRGNCYWPGCEGLAWEWWKRGNQLWRPVVWWKVDAAEGGTGIPGSGGRQWLRADWEYVLAFKKEGWLPWADNTAMGHEPVYDRVGGEMSNRTADGRRINEAAQAKDDQRWGGATRTAEGAMAPGSKDDQRGRSRGPWNTAGEVGLGGRRQNGQKKARKKMDAPAGHDEEVASGRPLPKVANPGNVIPLVVKARVGGGHMGHALCHENEAPFPEDLARFFVRSFCPPGGITLDPFVGSGTTVAVAVEEGRRGLGIDLRDSQVELARRRVEQVTPALFPE